MIIKKRRKKQQSKKIETRAAEKTHRKLLRRRRRRREVDVEGHGAAKRGAIVLVPLVVSIEHLHAADFSRLSIGRHFLSLERSSLPQSLTQFYTLRTVMNNCRDIFPFLFLATVVDRWRRSESHYTCGPTSAQIKWAKFFRPGSNTAPLGLINSQVGPANYGLFFLPKIK